MKMKTESQERKSKSNVELEHRSLDREPVGGFAKCLIHNKTESVHKKFVQINEE